MGFRIRHELEKRTGILAKRFPTDPAVLPYPDLKSGKAALKFWPWGERENFPLKPIPNPELEKKAMDILSGKIRMFNSFDHNFLKEEDWITHPETGFRYDNRKHWTKIPDMSPEAGDIKYVWEKSRFSYLHTILRYDHHFGQDHAEWVFSEMESWIRMNPINCGPNYRCSQEISLRVFNWLGALSFYRNHPSLSEERWQLFFHHMYWQIHHVWGNIQFSRIAVRNNHAITETLALYIFGSLFPQLPDSGTWKKAGKKWFEEEIGYQIYPDGSYLQFSMNYQRVVVQLLTLGIQFAEKAGESFSDLVYQRAHQTLKFLRFFQDPVSGRLPNYGANDGALFFQFTDSPFRVYNSQLNALQAALTGEDYTEVTETEEAGWFGRTSLPKIHEPATLPEKLQTFGNGGFAGIREFDTLTFFRSGTHKDRPSQADNHHLDLWYRGENILRDAGSFKYNAGEEDIRYFFGTRSHNTVMLDGHDQMLKGPRFVWQYWSQSIGLSARREETGWRISGEIEAFRQIGKGIRHKRTVFKEVGKPSWRIEDEVTGYPNGAMEVLWHPSPSFHRDFLLEVHDDHGNQLEARTEKGWYSGLYGSKEEADFYVFTTNRRKVTTHITPKI